MAAAGAHGLAALLLVQPPHLIACAAAAARRCRAGSFESRDKSRAHAMAAPPLAPNCSGSQLPCSVAMPTLCEENCGKQASFGLPTERRKRWCGGCAKSKGKGRAINLDAKLCEDCLLKTASFGLLSERKKRWCSGCGKGHGAVRLSKSQPKLCEDCGLKGASFGLLSERKRRWCGGCAKSKGKGRAVNLAEKLCEDCGLKSANFGLPSDPKRRRWCGGCAKDKGKGRAINLNAKLCEEGCGKGASFGLPRERKRRWCGGCVKQLGNGAILLQEQKVCQRCGKKRAGCNLAGGGVDAAAGATHCAECAKKLQDKVQKSREKLLRTPASTVGDFSDSWDERPMRLLCSWCLEEAGIDLDDEAKIVQPPLSSSACPTPQPVAATPKGRAAKRRNTGKQ